MTTRSCRTTTEFGLVDEAVALLDQAARHPIALTSTTLGEGIAGLGMTYLALHHDTGDQDVVERAVAAAETILATTDLVPTLGDNDAVGLLHGRAGLALFLQYAARVSGQDRYLHAGGRLLHDELDRAIRMPDGTLSFPPNATRPRPMPYLLAGSAGVTMVLTRYAAIAPKERFVSALSQLFDDIHRPCTMLPGLYCGLGGLAFALAEHADWSGDASHHAAALSAATGLVKYAIPHQTGVRFHGEGALRYSAELCSGAAGVLLSLHRLLHSAADQFFTLDRIGTHQHAAVPEHPSTLPATPAAQQTFRPSPSGPDRPASTRKRR